MSKYDISIQELKATMKLQGVKVKPNYHHDDYLFTSFTMPYPLKNKLDRVCRKSSLSRSKIVQMLINNIDENDILKSLGL